jgi:hypothetical protein
MLTKLHSTLSYLQEAIESLTWYIDNTLRR